MSPENLKENLAAFRCGRLLPSIGWCLEVAWIGKSTAVSSARKLLLDLSLVVRQLRSDATERAALQTQIADLAHGVTAYFASEDFADDRCAADVELIARAERHEVDELALDQWLARCCFFGAQLQQQLVSLLTDGSSNDQKLLLRLGQRIAELVVSPGHYRSRIVVEFTDSPRRQRALREHTERRNMAGLSQVAIPPADGHVRFLEAEHQWNLDDELTAEIDTLMHELRLEAFDWPRGSENAAPEHTGAFDLDSLQVPGLIETACSSAISRVERQLRASPDATPGGDVLDARGKAAYELLQDHQVVQKTAVRLFNESASKNGWSSVETVNGLKDIASRWAQRESKPPLARRKKSKANQNG